MIKRKLVAWALTKLIEYVEDHGVEHMEQLADWLLSLLERSDDQLFAAPPPVTGCEDLCESLVKEFEALRIELDNAG